MTTFIRRFFLTQRHKVHKGFYQNNPVNPVKKILRFILSSNDTNVRKCFLYSFYSRHSMTTFIRRFFLTQRYKGHKGFSYSFYSRHSMTTFIRRFFLTQRHKGHKGFSYSFYSRHSMTTFIRRFFQHTDDADRSRFS